MGTNLQNPIAVGREGNAFLLAESADIAKGEKNGDAQVHDLDSATYTDIKPLQVWFKWANYEDCTDAEYRTALKDAR